MFLFAGAVTGASLGLVDPRSPGVLDASGLDLSYSVIFLASALVAYGLGGFICGMCAWLDTQLEGNRPGRVLCWCVSHVAGIFFWAMMVGACNGIWPE